MRFRFLPLCLGFLAVGNGLFADEPSKVREAIKTVNSIGREATNSVEANKAARDLAGAPPTALPQILRGFDDTNPLAQNLLRAAVEAIADKARRSREELPTGELIVFIKQTKQHDARARRLAFELLNAVDSEAANVLLPDFLTDPSAELRHDSVAYWIGEAERLDKAGKGDEAKLAYQKALSGAVDDDQVKTIVKTLKERDVDVDIQHHFGFVSDWQAIGPFDNRGQKGFDVENPPEADVDLDATYQGQLGEVTWRPIATDSPYGVVDIGKTFDNWKGSSTYLTATFISPKDQQVELRLGTQNAWKLWLNGKYVFGREEYHRGMTMDQYRIPAQLKSGENTILLKLLQNEQTEDWAQDYKFQLRVADPAGQAVLPVEAKTGR